MPACYDVSVLTPVRRWQLLKGETPLTNAEKLFLHNFKAQGGEIPIPDEFAEPAGQVSVQPWLDSQAPLVALGQPIVEGVALSSLVFEDHYSPS